MEALPCAPLLTGSPVPSSCHRQRSQSSLPVLEQGPLAVSSTGCARAPCVSSQVIPYGYLDCIVARGGRQSTASTQKQHPFGCCFCVVSGGYLSFRALRTWSLRVGPGGPSFSFLCLSISPSLLRPLDAVGPDVSQAKNARCASWLELGPGRYIVIKDQRRTPCVCMVFFFGIRRLPIFPGRLQPSIVGV